MRVLIADKFPQEQQDRLARLGFAIRFEPDLSAEALPAAVGDAQILVVRSTKVTEATIKAARSLQLIVRAGAGTNTIDCKAASAHGIAVANCPGKNAIAVAELTLGLVLALDRRIPDNVADVRRGVWNKGLYGKARGLYGRALGVLGAGQIGREVIRRAQGFGMRTLAYDIALTAAQADELGVERCGSIDELMGEADVVCVHLPLSADTKHCVGAPQLARMRAGALLVNTSRGGVVDDAALAQAVAEGRIRAACDVYENEPAGSKGELTGPWATLDGFYGTHHIGASTDQAQAAVADETVAIIEAYQASGEVRHCVNHSRLTPAAGQVIVRHLDRVGVLATVLDVIRRADINVQEMQNTVFDGAVAASAKIRVERALTADELEAVRSSSPHIIGVEWIPSA
jgi:D-3-phosphoglycerate dehydrogenase